MVSPANLFRLVNEFILLLLGALLLLLAVTGRFGLPSRPVVLAAMGILFVYWGARAWARPEQKANHLQNVIRAGSLGLVGLVILAIPAFPLRRVSLLLGIAGSVLIVRGLLGGVLSLRQG